MTIAVFTILHVIPFDAQKGIIRRNIKYPRCIWAISHGPLFVNLKPITIAFGPVLLH